jgi:hypothetical protein
MKGITRRDFIKSTFAVGLVTALPYSRVQGANDRINVGLVRNMGTRLANMLICVRCSTAKI